MSRERWRVSVWSVSARMRTSRLRRRVVGLQSQRRSREASRSECHCRGMLRLALSLASNGWSLRQERSRRADSSRAARKEAERRFGLATARTSPTTYRVVGRFGGKRAVGMLVVETIGRTACQSASNFDPRSASKIDPLLVTGRRRQRSPRRSWSGLRSRGERGLARSCCLEDQARFLKRQLSLPDSTMSQ